MINWFEKNHKISLIIAVLIAIAMFYISSLTFEDSSSGSGGSIKAVLYHIFAYFFLVLFLNFSLVKGENTKFMFIAILISIFYGVADEIHQYFVPGRYASLSDAGLNTVGIILSSLFYLVSIEFRRKIIKSL